jgi:hypothetical protein
LSLMSQQFDLKCSVEDCDNRVNGDPEHNNICTECWQVIEALMGKMAHVQGCAQ